jgi:hypothetical protein
MSARRGDVVSNQRLQRSKHNAACKILQQQCSESSFANNKMLARTCDASAVCIVSAAGLPPALASALPANDGMSRV